MDFDEVLAGLQALKERSKKRVETKEVQIQTETIGLPYDEIEGKVMYASTHIKMREVRFDMHGECLMNLAVEAGKSAWFKKFCLQHVVKDIPIGLLCSGNFEEDFVKEMPGGKVGRKNYICDTKLMRVPVDALPTVYQVAGLYRHKPQENRPLSVKNPEDISGNESDSDSDSDSSSDEEPPQKKPRTRMQRFNAEEVKVIDDEVQCNVLPPSTRRNTILSCISKQDQVPLCDVKSKFIDYTDDQLYRHYVESVSNLHTSYYARQ